MDTEALRKKILDLAICGKLVPQDPNDEPASALLEKIRAEKQNMVKEGKLKPKDIRNDTIIFKGEDNLHYEKFQNGTVKCIENEIPFDVPEGWEWARLGAIAIFIGGYAYKSSKYVSDSKNIVVRIGNLKNNFFDPLITKTCIPDKYADETKAYIILENDILFTMTGTKGKRDYFFTYLVKHNDLKYNLFLNQRVGCLRVINQQLNRRYLVSCLQSSFALDSIFSTETGSANQGNIGSLATMNLLIPIPPKKEQELIIEKIQLAYENIHNLEDNKIHLNRDINILKSKILDLAVRGKLALQDPNDEPASVLLERIRTEKEELIKQGKIKRDKKASVIFKGDDNSYYEKVGIKSTPKCIDNEIPFAIPPSWEWVRLGEIFAHNTGKALNSSDTAGSLLPYITTSNLYWDHFILDSLKKMYFSESEIEKCTVKKGELLVCEGGDIGRAAIWEYDEEMRIQNHIHKLRPFIMLSNRFYYYVFYLWKQQERIGGQGIGLQGFSSKAIHNLIIPLPPLREQRKIVFEIDRIFSIINGIEQSLS